MPERRDENAKGNFQKAPTGRLALEGVTSKPVISAGQIKHAIRVKSLHYYCLPVSSVRASITSITAATTTTTTTKKRKKRRTNQSLFIQPVDLSAQPLSIYLPNPPALPPNLPT